MFFRVKRFPTCQGAYRLKEGLLGKSAVGMELMELGIVPICVLTDPPKKSPTQH